MPIRRGPATYSGYNDPSFGKAVSGIAQMFAPPDSSDLSNMATAAATREKAARLAELFTNRDAYTQDQFDRANAAVGNGTISSGYYGVNTKAATDLQQTRMQQSGENYRTGLNNTRALTEREMMETGLNTRATMAPQSENSTVFIPPDVAAANKIAAGPRTGIVSANRGEVKYGPGGQVYQGNAMPETEDQVKARELNSWLNGDPAAQARGRAVVAGSTPVENVIGPDGKPIMAYRTDAVGKAPYTAPGQPQLANYKGPDGTTGTARFDPSINDYVNTSTGERLPKGSVTYGANVQAPDPSGVGGKMTEGDKKTDLIANDMLPGIAALNQIYQDGKTVSSGALAVRQHFGDNPAVTDLAQRLGVIDPDDQMTMGAINSVMNQLYIKTGAARSEGEDNRGYSELVPLKSDTPEKRQFKRDLLNSKARAIIAQTKDPELKRQLSDAMDSVFVSPRANADTSRKSAGVSAAAAVPSIPGNTGTAPAGPVPSAETTPGAGMPAPTRRRWNAAKGDFE
jgi:hypothetical protein